MDRRPPPKWVPPGQGEPDLDHRKLREELEKTSSLPSGTYGPAMPDVETELLLDQGVRSLLGRLLATERRGELGGQQTANRVELERVEIEARPVRYRW